MICRHCSSTLAEDATFCDACGARAVATPTEDLFLGRTLLNQYIIKKKLGEGGFGAVYEAEQPSVGRKAAVKTLHRHLSYDAQMVERFRREGLAASRLKHPAAVQIYNSGATEDGILWIAMEFLEGKTLEARLREDGPLSPRELVEVMGPVCEVLEEAHEQGIVHRDLKPENIMLSLLHGKKLFPKLLDFGIAGLLYDDRVTQTGIVSGTPPYMAPEQWKGLKHVDARTDIYALGVICYQALSGRLPFEADTGPNWMYMHCFTEPVDLAEAMGGRALPPAFRALIHKTLAKEPSARYQTAIALQEALVAALGASSRAPDSSGGDHAAPASAARDSGAEEGAPRGSTPETILPQSAPQPPGPQNPTSPGVGPTLPLSPGEQVAPPAPPSLLEERERRPPQWGALVLVALLTVALTVGGLFLFGVFDPESEGLPPSLPPTRPATTLAVDPPPPPTTSVVTLPTTVATLPATQPEPPLPPTGECPQGAKRRKGKCVCIQASEILSPDGRRCVSKDVSPLDPPPTTKCPSGATLQGGKCVCINAGEVLSTDGARCISEVPEPLEELDSRKVQEIFRGAGSRIAETCKSFGTGKTTLTIVIGPSGAVTSVRTEASALSACVGGVVKKLKFPAFSGDPETIKIPFVIQ